MNVKMPNAGNIADAFQPQHLENPRLFSVYRKLIQDFDAGRNVGEVCERLRELMRERARRQA